MQLDNSFYSIYQFDCEINKEIPETRANSQVTPVLSQENKQIQQKKTVRFNEIIEVHLIEAHKKHIIKTNQLAMVMQQSSTYRNKIQQLKKNIIKKEINEILFTLNHKLSLPKQEFLALRTENQEKISGFQPESAKDFCKCQIF